MNRSNNCVYLNIIIKEKKAVLLLIPDDILIEKELCYKNGCNFNFLCGDKSYLNKKCLPSLKQKAK